MSVRRAAAFRDRLAATRSSMNQRNHTDAALAVSLLSDRTRRLAANYFDGAVDPAGVEINAELEAITEELRNISNALAGAEKCPTCHRYHDEERVPERCRK